MAVKEYKYESKMKFELDGSISGLQSLLLLKVKRIEEIELRNKFKWQNQKFR